MQSKIRHTYYREQYPAARSYLMEHIKLARCHIRSDPRRVCSRSSSIKINFKMFLQTVLKLVYIKA
jgi:hypothetical protein